MKFLLIFLLFILSESFIIENTNTNVNNNYLLETIKKLSHRKKGILAIDESIPTIGKRFLNINLKNNKKNRKNYRTLLLQTPDLEKYITGCILHEEDLYEKVKNNQSYISYLHKRNILPGVKLDLGLKEISNNTFISLGLDTLENKCKKYSNDGIRFAKWRTVFKIMPNKTNNLLIFENCHTLAKYAKICQNNNIVPIVEPEILMTGNHNIYTTAKIQETILKNLFKIFDEYNIILETTILKTNMVVPGESCQHCSYPNQIAEITIRTMERSVPSSIPIIAFLSGGLTEKKASLNLNAINKLKKKSKWNLTFSFGRALQDSCLKTWKGKKKYIYESQKILIDKLIDNTKASIGKYNYIKSI